MCADAQVPISAAMAVQLRSVAKHEEDERAEIKRLVLKANKDLDLAGSAGKFNSCITLTPPALCNARDAQRHGSIAQRWTDFTAVFGAAYRPHALSSCITYWNLPVPFQNGGMQRSLKTCHMRQCLSTGQVLA